MHPFDAIAGIVLATGVIRGYSTGLFKQVGAVVGFVLAFATAAALMRAAGDLCILWFSASADLAPILGFLAVFLVVYGVVMVVAWFAEEAFGALRMGFVNHFAGAAVGGLKAALLFSLALIFLAYVHIPSEEARRDAQLYAPLSMLAPNVWSWISDNSEAFDELTKRLEIEIDRQLSPDAGGSVQ